MKSAWRKRLAKIAFGCAGVGSLAAFGGCQSWSPSSWGVPTSTRVPAPPTGTVQPQGAYYNNVPGASAAPPKATTQFSSGAPASVVQASANDPFGTNRSMPATSMPATNMPANSAAYANHTEAKGFQKTGGQVSTAGYNDNGTGMAQVVTAASMQGQPPANATHFNSDDIQGENTGEGANLQWTAK